MNPAAAAAELLRACYRLQRAPKVEMEKIEMKLLTEVS